MNQFKRGDKVKHKLDGRQMIVLEPLYFLPAQPPYQSDPAKRKAAEAKYKADVKKATAKAIGYECRLHDQNGNLGNQKFRLEELEAVNKTN